MKRGNGRWRSATGPWREVLGTVEPGTERRVPVDLQPTVGLGVVAESALLPRKVHSELAGQGSVGIRGRPVGWQWALGRFRLLGPGLRRRLWRITDLSKSRSKSKSKRAGDRWWRFFQRRLVSCWCESTSHPAGAKCPRLAALARILACLFVPLDPPNAPLDAHDPGPRLARNGR